MCLSKQNPAACGGSINPQLFCRNMLTATAVFSRIGGDMASATAYNTGNKVALLSSGHKRLGEISTESGAKSPHSRAIFEQLKMGIAPNSSTAMGDMAADWQARPGRSVRTASPECKFRAAPVGLRALTVPEKMERVGVTRRAPVLLSGDKYSPNKQSGPRLPGCRLCGPRTDHSRNLIAGGGQMSEQVS